MIALAGALAIRNTKMQTKAEEEEAMRVSREKAAAEAGVVRKEVDLEKGEGGGVGVGVGVGAGTEVRDAERDERELVEAEAVASVGPVPAGAVQGGVDAQRVLASERRG